MLRQIVLGTARTAIVAVYLSSCSGAGSATQKSTSAGVDGQQVGAMPSGPAPQNPATAGSDAPPVSAMAGARQSAPPAGPQASAGQTSSVPAQTGSMTAQAGSASDAGLN